MQKNRVLRLLYFTQIFYPAIYGGGEYIFYKWARELARRGNRVIVITQNIRGIKSFEEHEGVTIIRVGPPVDYRGVLPPSLFHNLGYLLMGALFGSFAVLRYGVDIVHSNTYIPAFAGQAVSSTFHRPHVITVHDVYGLTRSDFWSKWSSQFGESNHYSTFASIIEKLCLALPASIFHTVSETSRSEIQRFCLGRVVFVPNGVDEEDYISAESGDGGYALFIGRLVFYKNLDVVIRAVNEFGPGPGRRLVIVGDGPYRGELEKIAQRNEGVVFKGRVSSEEKVKLLNGCSFLVLPSLIEGFGIVIVEAFACKKPVLVSDVMPLPELVEDGVEGFSLPPFSPHKWCEKMTQLFDNPEVTRSMGMNGYDKYRKLYSLGVVVDMLEGLYCSALFGN